MFKKARFWLSLFSVIVIIVNLTGNDDKSLLLFFTNPLGMFMLEYGPPNDLPFEFYYFLHIVFWFIVGWLIDMLISRLRRR